MTIALFLSTLKFQNFNNTFTSIKNGDFSNIMFLICQEFLRGVNRTNSVRFLQTFLGP